MWWTRLIGEVSFADSLNKLSSIVWDRRDLGRGQALPVLRKRCRRCALPPQSKGSILCPFGVRRQRESLTDDGALFGEEEELKC